MKIVWVILFATCAASHACKRVDDKPTDVNERGEYFNCYIDGEYWTFKQSPGTNNDHLFAGVRSITLPAYRLQAFNSTDRTWNTEITIHMVEESFPSRDTFDLTTYTDGGYATIDGPNAHFRIQDFITSDQHTGKLVFTQRSASRLEGVFYFDAYRPDTNVVIHVTNGRFSVIPD